MCLFLERMDFPGGLDGNESAYNAGDLGSIPGSGRSPREGNPQGCKKSDMTERITLKENISEGFFMFI